MNFIELTDTKGNKVIVNTNNIVVIEKYEDGSSITPVKSNYYSFEVKETPEEIYTKIKECK